VRHGDTRRYRFLEQEKRKMITLLQTHNSFTNAFFESTMKFTAAVTALLFASATAFAPVTQKTRQVSSVSSRVRFERKLVVFCPNDC
jgi:hypothetical protein